MPDYPHAPQATRFDAPPTAPVFVSAVDPAFVSWATSKGWTVTRWGSANWFESWGPFVFLPQFDSIGLELSADFGEPDVWIIEAFRGAVDWDVSGRPVHSGEKSIIAFVTSPQLTARGAVRSRIGATLTADLGHTIGKLFSGGSKKSGLGDDQFESMFEISIPSVDEGRVALTPALRAHLLAVNFRGIVEFRAGGFICMTFGHMVFDPTALEKEIAAVGEIYRTALTR